MHTLPSIPQFILDIQHPWIKENKSWIQKLPNSHYALSSLDSPYRQPQTSGITYPKDLYKTLKITNNRGVLSLARQHQHNIEAIDPEGWEDAIARLKEMQECPAALNDVENFHVSMYLDLERTRDHIASPKRRPPPELLQLFISVLNAMPNLRYLYWNTYGDAGEYFEKAFSQANLTLPSVLHLVLGERSEFLIPFCPNIEKLKIHAGLFYEGYYPEPHPRLKIFELAKGSKNLSTLKLGIEWNVKRAEAMFDAIPQIKDLSLFGGLERDRYRYTDYDEPETVTGDEPEMNTGSELKAILEVLKKFPNLEHVEFPEADGLYLGFGGWSRCGNIYLGKRGRELARRVSKREAEAMEKAAEIIISILPGLKSFTIGRYSPTLDATGSGVSTIVWPWTGRMEEWTYERYPDRPEGYDRE